VGGSPNSYFKREQKKMNRVGLPNKKKVVRSSAKVEKICRGKAEKTSFVVGKGGKKGKNLRGSISTRKSKLFLFGARLFGEKKKNKKKPSMG